MKKGNSDNQSGILFPVAEEISRTETDLIAMIKTTGKEKDYELIEYILNVNTQYTQVLMELNENGAMDAVYTYGVSRLTEDRFTGESNFYLYDPAGNVAGITDQNGYLWQFYQYDAFGNAIFGNPQYDNEYTFNAESYNPNILEIPERESTAGLTDAELLGIQKVDDYLAYTNLIYGVSNERVKEPKINVNPEGVEHYQPYKLKGSVPEEIKKLFRW